MGQETAKDSPKLSQEELAGVSIRWLCGSCWISPKVPFDIHAGVSQ